MRHTALALATATGLALAACGGGDDAQQGGEPGSEPGKVKYASMVTFGDGYSDVGSYAVGSVTVRGGGKYTINGDGTALDPVLTGKIWTEVIAAQLGLPAPCAAQTGLDAGFDITRPTVPVVNHAGCFNYAQGGARVTDPVGIGHKQIASSPFGALTVPVVAQVADHLARTGNAFRGDEIVFVMAGTSDVLHWMAYARSIAESKSSDARRSVFASTLDTLLAAGAPDPVAARAAIASATFAATVRGLSREAILQAAVDAAVRAGNTAAPAGAATIFAQAVAAADRAFDEAAASSVVSDTPALVASATTAAAELVALVRSQLVGKGAGRVVVVNLPDTSVTPGALAGSAEVRVLAGKMVAAFNEQLRTGLAADGKVLVVDAYTASRDQAANPGQFGLSNATQPACRLEPRNADLHYISLGCSLRTLEWGDVYRYAWADMDYPTPLAHQLLARNVAQAMAARGW